MAQASFSTFPVSPSPWAFDNPLPAYYGPVDSYPMPFSFLTPAGRLIRVLPIQLQGCFHVSV